MSKANSKNFSKILLRGSAIVSISEASTKLIVLILLPLFSRYMTPEDFGVVSMVTIIITALSLIYNPGMTSATMRLYHDTKDLKEQQVLIGSASKFYLFFPLIITVLLILTGPYFFSSLFNDFAFYPFGLLAVILAFFTQNKNIWMTMMMLQYRIGRSAVYTFSSVIIGLIASVILVVEFNLGSLGRVLGMFPSALFLFFVSFLGLKKYTQGFWTFESIKKQLWFGLPLVGAIWSTSLLQVVDRFIIEKMTDMHSVGIFSFAFQIAQIPIFLVVGIRQIWNPIFYENMNNKDYKVISKLIYIYNFILSTICILIILFSKELIYWFIDSRYYEAIPIISILVIGIYFSGLLLLPNSALTYEKRFGITSWIAIFATVINIVINILLIPSLGVMGSAIATAIAYLFYFLTGYLLTRSITFKISTIKNIFVPPLLVGLATSLSILFSSQLPSMLESTVKIVFFIGIFISFLLLGKIGIKEIRLFFNKRLT